MIVSSSFHEYKQSYNDVHDITVDVDIQRVQFYVWHSSTSADVRDVVRVAPSLLPLRLLSALGRGRGSLLARALVRRVRGVGHRGRVRRVRVRGVWSLRLRARRAARLPLHARGGLLAVVLFCVREGVCLRGTGQRQGYKRRGRKTGRTSSSCCFFFSSPVRISRPCSTRSGLRKSLPFTSSFMPVSLSPVVYAHASQLIFIRFSGNVRSTVLTAPFIYSGP